MSAKRFKTVSGYVTDISPVKEGKKQHNWAEAFIQTGGNTEERVLFFFEKPKQSSPLYESAVSAFDQKTAVAVSGLSEDKEGVYLTNRKSEIKNRHVSFDRREITTSVKIETVTNNTTAEETISITGRVVKLNPILMMLKYDNVTHQKLQKKYRTGVIADITGAVLVMLWEDIAENIHEQQSVSLSNMRNLVDAQGICYLTTTFRTQFKNLLETELNYDEEAAEPLLDVELTLFHRIECIIDSISVDLQVTCPRCNTKLSSNERLVVCTKCRATFRSKDTSIRVELTVTEIGQEKQYQLVAYKDLIVCLVGSTDQASISEFFMADNKCFKISFHCRSKVIEQIEEIK